MTGIDIVDQIWALLNVPSVTSLLGGGKVWKHNRPQNSPFTDVVISVPEYVQGTFNRGTISVNIHTPNLKEYYPIPGGTQDNTFPNLAVLREVTNAVLPLLVGTAEFSLVSKTPGFAVRDKDGSWYSHISVGFEAIDPATSTDATLQREVTTPDGYAGVTVTLTQVWSGKAAQQNIDNGSQLEISLSGYEFNLRCDWLVPAAAAPQKDMQLHTDEGRYVINGIKPEGNFWRLSTVRKDGPY